VVFAAAEYEMVPTPVPLLAEVIVSQFAELEADHVQVVGVGVTVTDPVPPEDGKFCPVDDNV
jgi:hypothetical protein